MAVPQPITTPTPAQQEARRRVAEGSWASVAATETSPSNTLVKFHPSDAITRAVVEPTIDVSANDLRVVWLLSWPAARPLSAATKQLNDYGALLSVAHVPDSEAVCIIFQRTHQAQAFLGGNEKRKAATGTGLFGPAVEVIQGDPYPTNDDLRAMDMPFNERRRLTFARSALFTAQNGLTEAIFKQDIHALVGEHNVELVWLFNSGNGEYGTFLTSSMLTTPSYRDLHCYQHCSNRQKHFSPARHESWSIQGRSRVLLARSLRETTSLGQSDVQWSVKWTSHAIAQPESHAVGKHTSREGSEWAIDERYRR